MIESLAEPMSSPGPPRVVVVGGGVSGLTAAYAVKRARPDVEVTLFEAERSVGGNIRTERHDDFLIDAGPDSFIRTKPAALELVRELGLESELVRTREAGRHVFMARGNRLEPMPADLVLAIPTRIAPLLETPLVSARGKVRMLAEPFVRRRRVTDDESIHSFFERRLGVEAAERLASPLLGGIYAGDARALSVRSAFPGLVEHEARHGSLLLGMLAAERARTRGDDVQAAKAPRMAELFAWLCRPSEGPRPSPFLSFQGGMSRLVEALARALPEGAIHAGSPVTDLHRLPNGAYLVRAHAREVVADGVIVATPAHVAARLVPDAKVAAELAAIRALSTAIVFFGLGREDVASKLAGSGFIAAQQDAKILAGTWVSSKWEGRAPGGASLVRAFVGGAREPERVESSTDEELVELSRRELERLMGPLGAPLFTRVYRYVRASPQPVVGHGARLARIRAGLARLPGLRVTGASYDGVGIPDCIRQAQAAALSVVSALPGARAS